MHAPTFDRLLFYPPIIFDEGWHLSKNAPKVCLQVLQAELPRVRKALAPNAVIDPATLTPAERLQWKGRHARAAIDEQLETLATAGGPIKQTAWTAEVAL